MVKGILFSTLIPDDSSPSTFDGLLVINLTEETFKVDNIFPHIE
ncbi:uncharacterized protein METZ01_LOCUS84074 [marine metagenome]|uniref:Uncharacterized protein n=1 Tax=marine metagenome TaxID=408172 RepID=A0A381UT03_9ZZZZ